MFQKKVVTLRGVSVLTVNFRVLVVVRNTRYNFNILLL
jgi:hypothetical protein